MKKVLKQIPSELENILFEEFKELKRRFQLNDSGPTQLNGGRFAEAMLRIFQYLLGETITPLGEDVPANEKTKTISKIVNHPSIDEHIRQKVSSLTRLLLDFRNNRDVAHLGGFKANNIDAYFILNCANWIVAELIRVYGDFSMPDAQKIIDSLAVQDFPVIFNIEGEEFIARADLTSSREVLVLLLKEKRDFLYLFSKTKDGNRSRFSAMLKLMENKRLIAEKGGFYHLLPNGIKTIQAEGLLDYSKSPTP